MGLFDKERRALVATAEELRDELAGLKAERKAREKELQLTDSVIRLKTEIEDLRISKGRIEEENAKEKRELTHMIGLEKKRQEQELEAGKRDAILTVREENLEADKDRFEEQMEFSRKRFEQEVGYLKDLMGQILERLPVVTVDRVDKATPQKDKK